MAKRKTPKSEKIVDLKPKAEKLTQEELVEVQKLAAQFDLYHQEIGSLESKKHQLLHYLTNLQGLMQDLQNKLKEKYGDVDIDIRSGEFKQPENGQVDKKD